jgi:hypothetical protein
MICTFLGRKTWLSEKCRLAHPNLDLDDADAGRARHLRRFELKFQCFLQVGKSIFLGLALTGDIELQAL